MIDAADQAYVIYDPIARLDAMHAALFTRHNVTPFRMRFMGNALQTDLLDMDHWVPLLHAAAEDRLDTTFFAKLFRARRNHKPYLINLLTNLQRNKRHGLVKTMCRNVNSRMRIRRFRKTLENIEAAEAAKTA
jgi:hypothetical protein